MESHPLVISLEHSNGQEVSLTIDPHDDFSAFLRKAQHPLVISLEHSNGQVPLTIDPHDVFSTFLRKAQSVLGYEIDIKSVAKNHPVSLTDNIYDFLLKTQGSESQMSPGFIGENPDGTDEDLTYVLGDGTLIHASQIHFDNEDPLVDVTAEDIPFIKHKDDDSFDETNRNINDYETKVYKIIDNPTKTSASNPNYSLANNLPFQLICNNFETQFTKFVIESSGKAATNLKKLPAKNNYHYEAGKTKNYTREKVLDIFKDTPVDAKIVNTTDISDKRKHARKCDPTKFVQPPRSSKPTTYIDNRVATVPKDQNCYVCGVIIEKDSDKVLIFNKEDQSHVNPKKQAPINVVCLQCLEDNYKPSQLCITPDPQYSGSNESFVIKDELKYQENKTDNTSSMTKVAKGDKVAVIDIEEDNFEEKIDNFIVKASNTKEPEVVTVDLDLVDDVSNILQDEEVVRFLKKHNNEGVHDTQQLKCRFCEQVFQNIADLSVHAFKHRHVSDDGIVFPCPLCAYGYADFLWLRGHLKTAHEIIAKDDEPAKTGTVVENADKVSIENFVAETGNDASIKKEKVDDVVAENVPETIMETSVNIDIVKTEVKEENVDSSDEEIWIVQTRDDEADRQMEILIGAANKQNEKISNALSKNNDAGNGDQYYLSGAKKLRCAKRRITTAEGDKGGQGKKRKTKEAQVITCHGCNEQFTSKVRLRFHLQFHETTTNNNNLVSADGRYICASCPDISFETDSQLFDHLHFQHSREKYWKCQFKGCGKIFHMRSTLTKHGRTHSDTRRYVCGTCGKRFFDKQTLDEHSVTHLKIKPYQCHICMKQLTRRSRLRMHLRAHMEEPSPRLVCACAVCAAAFKDTHDAEEHLINSPECMQKYASLLKLEETGTKQLSPTSGIVRTTVQVKIEDPTSLTTPIKNQVDSVEATRLLTQLSPSARVVIRVVEIEKALRCEFCEQVFYTEEGLNKHRAIHKGVLNPYVCHICKVNFSTYSRCTTHKTTHGFFKRAVCTQKSADVVGYGDFPVVKHFLCEDCGRTYLHWTYLQVHRRTKHVGHPCPQCHRMFPNSWSLGIHKKNECQDIKIIKIDTRDIPNYGERYHRIPCRDCDEFLPNKTALYRHRKNAHSDLLLIDDTEHSGTEGTLRSQSFINKQTVQENQQVGDSKNPDVGMFKSLGGHSLRNPSVLDLQNCQPLKLSAVRNHRLIQGGVQAWQCSRCPKRFRIRSDLRVHERIKHHHYADGLEHIEYPVAWGVSVIQMSGLEPSPQEVLNALSNHGVHSDSVTHISRISFGKGTSSIVPDCPQALKSLQATLAKNDSVPQSVNTVIDLQSPKSILAPPILPAPSTSEPKDKEIVCSVPEAIDVAPPPQENQPPATPVNDAGEELQDLQRLLES